MMSYPSIDNGLMRPPPWVVTATEANRALVKKIETLDLLALLEVKSLKVPARAQRPPTYCTRGNCLVPLAWEPPSLRSLEVKSGKIRLP